MRIKNLWQNTYDISCLNKHLNAEIDIFPHFVWCPCCFLSSHTTTYILMLINHFFFSNNPSTATFIQVTLDDTIKMNMIIYSRGIFPNTVLKPSRDHIFCSARQTRQTRTYYRCWQRVNRQFVFRIGESTLMPELTVETDIGPWSRGRANGENVRARRGRAWGWRNLLLAMIEPRFCLWNVWVVRWH